MGERYVSWFKASIPMWEDIVRDESRAGVSKSVADLDLKYLDQQKKDLSYGQLASRWGWAKSKVYRHVQSKMGTGTKTERKRNDKRTTEVAVSAVKAKKPERTENVQRTLAERPLIKSKKKRREEIINASVSSPPKPKPKKGSDKRSAIAVFCEEYKSAFGTRYEVSGTDLGSAALLGDKVSDSPEQYRSVVRRYIDTKESKGFTSFIGSCPPGKPSLRQLGDYYSEFASESEDVVGVRGSHGKAERVPSKLF